MTHIPVRIREEDRQMGRGAPLPTTSFERICFDKKFINQQPVAEFVCPGHPILDAVLGLVHQQNAHLLKQGAVMVDEADYSEQIEALFLIEHEIKDGRTISSGAKQTISKRMQFARLGVDGEVGHGGIAPHLNLRPVSDEELRLVEEDLSAAWLKGNIEDQIKAFSIEELARAQSIRSH